MFTFLRRYIELLFPDTCISCGRVNAVLCAECQSVHLITPSDTYSPLPSYIHSVFTYRHSVIKQAIWLLKYKNKRTVATELAPLLSDVCTSLIEELITLSGAKTVYIIPIPLHSTRLRERGYNQSLLLAEALLVLDTTTHAHLLKNVLIRSKYSSPNARTHSKREREENTRGSFEVTDPSRISDAHIILIDDVVTTGTTIKEARKVLLASGARSVQAVMVAH